MPAVPRGVFLVSPDGFALAEQSAIDNAYMQRDGVFDAERALAQHRGLQRRIAQSLPAICFPGDPETPAAVFANNVFATTVGSLLIAPRSDEHTSELQSLLRISYAI